MVARAAAPSAGSSAAPMWSMRMSRRPRQQARGGEQRLGRLLLAQMADHHRAQPPARLGQGPPRGGRLEDDAGLGANFGGQCLRPALLQDHQNPGQPQRAPGRRIAADVAIQVGAGQHQRQAAPRMRGAPTRRWRRPNAARAARSSRCPRPPAHPASPARCARDHAPARCRCQRQRRLPVAVVGVAQRRADDDDLGHTGAPSHRSGPPHEHQPSHRRPQRRSRRTRRGDARGAGAHAGAARCLCRRARRDADRSVLDRSSIRRCGKRATSAGSRTSGSRAIGSGIWAWPAIPTTPVPTAACRGADALYDSSRVAHATRWHLPLPDLGGDARLPGRGPGRNAGAARRRRRRPTASAVFLPPLAVPRGHARRGRHLDGAGARTFRCPRRCAPPQARCPPRRDVAMRRADLAARLRRPAASRSTTSCSPTT